MPIFSHNTSVMNDMMIDEAATSESSRVAVLGDGIAALVLALRFAQAGRVVTFVGRFDELTRRKPLTVRPNDRNAMRLLEELCLLEELDWSRRVQMFGSLGERTQGTLIDG